MQTLLRNIAAAVTVLAVIPLPGCQTGSSEEATLVFFPAPPEQPRVQFLTWASGADEVEPRHGAFEEFVLGEEPSIERKITKPYGVAARDGVVYVCDTKGLSLVRLDFAEHRFDRIGISGPGRLRKPLNVVIDPLGYKFVMDSVRKQAVIFGPDDKYVTAFDIPEPCHPVDLALYENELYVLDNDDSCQILVLDRKTGSVLRTFGGPGGEPGQFKIPGSLCVGPEGNVYVSDTHNWRLQKLTREGEPIWVTGVAGYRIGQFGRPRGIRVDDNGIVYVVDGATEIVQMFDSEGNTLMRFGGPGNVPGALGLPASLAIDKTSIPYFQQYVHKDFKVEHLMFVASQFGRRLINVYAFGSFPEGYKLSTSEIATISTLPMEEGIGPVGEEATDEEPIPKESPHSAPEGE